MVTGGTDAGGVQQLPEIGGSVAESADREIGAFGAGRRTGRTQALVCHLIVTADAGALKSRGQLSGRPATQTFGALGAGQTTVIAGQTRGRTCVVIAGGTGAGEG